MRSLTIKERNFINNLPLEPYKKQRIENVWCMCTEPVINQENETKKSSKPSINKWVLIPLMAMQFYFPHWILDATNQVLGWGVASIIIATYIVAFSVWKKMIAFPLLPESLNRLYKPLPNAIYVHYILELVIVYLMALCGYTYLAIFYAIGVIGLGIIGNMLYTSHTKKILHGGPEIDIKIAILKEFSLKQKMSQKPEVYITVNDKKIF